MLEAPPKAAPARRCRHCGGRLAQSFADLGTTPLANSYVLPERAGAAEPFYRLHAMVCADCLLVSLEDAAKPEDIFSDYAYFSSFSDSWLEHARAFAEAACGRFGLSAKSFVLEIASNDGYLLRNFVERGVPCLGVEPAKNVAEEARRKGVPTVCEFFGPALAERLVSEGKSADLIVGNNVLAHVPDPGELLRGAARALSPRGVLSMEFPHLLKLIEQTQFDTIYHEHFSYFSFLAAKRAFERAGLSIFDVEELATHGGSLRVSAGRAGAGAPAASGRVLELERREREAGLERLETYAAFSERVRALKRELLTLLIGLKAQGKTLAAYGAPAKGNTLLNYCGIRGDFLDFTVDRSPHKQGRLLPGTRIPIRAPEELRRAKPDYVLILPWNLKDEVLAQTAFVREWGGRYILPSPAPAIV